MLPDLMLTSTTTDSQAQICSTSCVQIGKRVTFGGIFYSAICRRVTEQHALGLTLGESTNFVFYVFSEVAAFQDDPKQAISLPLPHYHTPLMSLVLDQRLYTFIILQFGLRRSRKL